MRFDVKASYTIIAKNEMKSIHGYELNDMKFWSEDIDKIVLLNPSYDSVSIIKAMKEDRSVYNTIKEKFGFLLGNVNQEDFFKKVYQNVLKHTPQFTSTIPNSKEEFHKSPIWKKLGFNIDEDFEVLYIMKKVKIIDDELHPLYYESIICLEDNVVAWNHWNELSNHLTELFALHPYLFLLNKNEIIETLINCVKNRQDIDDQDLLNCINNLLKEHIDWIKDISLKRGRNPNDKLSEETFRIIKSHLKSKMTETNYNNYYKKIHNLDIFKKSDLSICKLGNHSKKFIHNR